MWRDRNRRAELRKMLVNTLPAMQRVIRGFIGFKGSKKLAYLRSSFRSWCKPQFAVQFLRDHLEKSVIMFPPKVLVPTYSTLRKPVEPGDTSIDVHNTDIFTIGMDILVGAGKNVETRKFHAFDGCIVFDKPLKHSHKEGTMVRIEKVRPTKPKHTRRFLPKRLNGKKLPQDSEYYPYAVFDECVKQWYEDKVYCE